MKYVVVSCGTGTNPHPKNTSVKTLNDAYRIVRNFDADELNYVHVTIHLVKEDLSGEAFRQVVRDVMQIDDKMPAWGEHEHVF